MTHTLTDAAMTRPNCILYGRVRAHESPCICSRNWRGPIVRLLRILSRFTPAMTDQRDRDSGESSGDEVSSSYDAWLNEKVTKSLASTRPNIPHSEVERRMAERIRSRQVTGKADLKKGGAGP